jgi:Phage tail tube protein
MARAYGSSAHLLMKRETVYGQVATGNYIRMPFNRCNLGSEQGLIDDPVLGQGRDPLAPLQDVINDEGDIVMPVDPRYLGLWLTGLFGDPDTTDNLDGSWDHEFASGGDDLPSYTIEVGMPKVPAFFVHAGVKLNSIALGCDFISSLTDVPLAVLFNEIDMVVPRRYRRGLMFVVKKEPSPRSKVSL